ncbi:MAG: alpha/beta fold hydrolase [bacterium]
MIRWAIGMLLTVVAMYVLLVVAAALFQRRLIYFPTVVSPAIAAREAAERGFVAWRNTTGQVIGWKLPASGPRNGSVLVVHGNAGSAIDRDYFARPIHNAAGVDVYTLEYPGYGMRDGSPSITSLLAAADDAFDLLPANEPVYVVGESLGCGVASHLAQTKQDKVSGIALFMPYDNFVSVAQAAMPFLPAWLVLRERFAPDVWLERYRGPIKFVLAGADEVIPTRLGQRLYDGYAGPKELQIVPGARHNDAATQTEQWWKAVFSFWERDRRRAI